MTSACSTSRERTGCQMNWITLPLLNLLSFFLVETQLAQQSHGKKTPKTLVMLILSIATGIVVITVILLVHIWYRRRKHSNKMQHVVGDDSSQHLCSCFPSLFICILVSFYAPCFDFVQQLAFQVRTCMTKKTGNGAWKMKRTRMEREWPANSTATKFLRLQHVTSQIETS